MVRAMKDSGDDAALALAFSVYSNPGAYALLIGAGVSAPTVKTAWGVLVDLCEQIADLEGEDAGEDAAIWYEAKYGKEPEYGALLERLAPTGEERQRILANYFEPTRDDVEQGLKVPTPAHQAIARLVADGWVRVIVTLNFDRLIETALRENGIEPTVVASPADIAGLAPLHTLKACVIHLHGDYLTPTAMLNTETELAKYPKRTRALVDQVLREYGLVIAGWSATYETKLRDMVSISYPGRYSLTWVEPGSQSPVANDLLVRKHGRLIPDTADNALGKLADAVSALSTRQARHPLSVPVAVQTAKRELSGRSVAIGLHDRLAAAFTTLHELHDLSVYNEQAKFDELVLRIEEAVQVPAALVATVAYWGDESTDDWWVDELERFAVPLGGSGLTKLLDIKTVAGTWLAYAAGVGATAGRRFNLLRRLLHADAPEPFHRSGRTKLYRRLNPIHAFDSEPLITEFYTRAAPLLREALSLGPTPLDAAWQQFEIVRLADLTMSTTGFATLYAEYEPKQAAADAADRQFMASGQNPELQERRRATWLEAHQALGRLAHLSDPQGLHLLSAEINIDQYVNPVAERLRADVRGQGDRHPLVASKILPDSLTGETVLRAVSAKVGIVGDRRAWARASSSSMGYGSIPSAVWLDTGKPPT